MKPYPFTLSLKDKSKETPEVTEWLRKTEELVAEKMKTARYKVTIYDQSFEGTFSEVTSKMNQYIATYGPVEYELEIIKE